MSLARLSLTCLCEKYRMTFTGLHVVIKSAGEFVVFLSALTFLLLIFYNLKLII